MKIDFRFFIATAALLFAPLIPVLAQDKGEATFKQICAACHTIGRGKLVGPDLHNVQERHTEEWLLKFVKSSQSVIKSGDKYADSLFKAFNQMPMPDRPELSDGQIKDVIAYIKTNSSTGASATTATPALTGNAQRGRDLFVGKIRFINNGAACNSCHNVDMKGFMSGGALGKDLTHAVTRLSAAGVAGIVSGLPFPQMKETYAIRPVTNQEIADITAFLTSSDKQASVKATSNVGTYLLAGGVAGIIILLALFSFFWVKRKRRPVNYAVFSRQIKSI